MLIRASVDLNGYHGIFTHCTSTSLFLAAYFFGFVSVAWMLMLWARVVSELPGSQRFRLWIMRVHWVIVFSSILAYVVSMWLQIANQYLQEQGSAIANAAAMSNIVMGVSFLLVNITFTAHGLRLLFLLRTFSATNRVIIAKITWLMVSMALAAIFYVIASAVSVFMFNSPESHCIIDFFMFIFTLLILGSILLSLRVGSFRFTRSTQEDTGSPHVKSYQNNGSRDRRSRSHGTTDNEPSDRVSATASNNALVGSPSSDRQSHLLTPTQLSPAASVMLNGIDLSDILPQTIVKASTDNHDANQPTPSSHYACEEA